MERFEALLAEGLAAAPEPARRGERKLRFPIDAYPARSEAHGSSAETSTSP
jgi:hypothetical protein